jgi:hypothetical protein
MTQEEFEKRWGCVYDYVIGVDSDLQKTLVDKRTGEHWALTRKNYDEIYLLFEELSKD